MDKLEEIFRMQDALNRRIGVNLPPPTDEEKARWVLNYTRALQQETAELREGLSLSKACRRPVEGPVEDQMCRESASSLRA